MYIVCFMCVLVCTDKLGVENGDIPDRNFEASDGKAHKARLNTNKGEPWHVSTSYSSPWIQVDLGDITSVSGLLTQGYAGRWITQLKVSTFAAADDPKVFIKDEDGNDKVICILCTQLFLYRYFHQCK